jgi:hypothetical protein
VWTLLFDGVFRVQVDVWPSASTVERDAEREHGFVGRQDGEGLLFCPSGQLVVEAISRLGEPALRTIVVVPPGADRVRLESNDDEVMEHSFLEAPAAYVETGRPDWRLLLAREASIPRD